MRSQTAHVLRAARDALARLTSGNPLATKRDMEALDLVKELIEARKVKNMGSRYDRRDGKQRAIHQHPGGSTAGKAD